MAGGLVGLLDDIAALAKLAAASIDDVGAAAGRASAKAAGVVVDDTAVTPAYVQGLAAERELPIIKKIATGSLKNKLLFILPAALLLSADRADPGRSHPDVRRHVPVLRGCREDLPQAQRRRPRSRSAGCDEGPRSRGRSHQRCRPN